MLVYLINPPTKKDKTNIVRDMAGGFGLGAEGMLLPPIDLAYIAAVLETSRHKVKIFDCDADDHTKEDILKEIHSIKPKLVGINLSLPTLFSDMDLLLGIQDMGIITFGRGTIVDVCAEQILQKGANLLVRGECEETVLDLIRYSKGKVKLKDILGISFQEDGKKYHNPARGYLKALDKLPFPARHLLPNKAYSYPLIKSKGKITSIISSRGCPYPCFYYCPYPVSQGRVWRARSAENVAREMRYCVKNLGIRTFLFRDALFTLDQKRVIDLCDKIKSLKTAWWCETRIDCLSKELLNKMKETGCLGLNLGVETGDSAFLKKAKPGLTPEKIAEVLEHTRSIGLKYHLLFMIGLPGETKESILSTFNLIRKIRPESMGLLIATPYPGTPFSKDAESKGWVTSEDISLYNAQNAIVQYPNLSAKEIKYARDLIYTVSYCLFWRRPVSFLTRLYLIPKGIFAWLKFKLWVDD